MKIVRRLYQSPYGCALEQPASKKDGKEASDPDAVRRTDLHEDQKPNIIEISKYYFSSKKLPPYFR